MPSKISVRQPAVLGCVIFVLGLEIAGPSQAWMILLVTLGGATAIAFFWTLSLSRNLSVRRETRLSWVSVGGQIEERLTLSNTSLLPAPWVEFKDQSTLPNFDADRATGIPAGSFDQWTASAQCRQRGLFYLGDAQITSGDPFGIFDVSVPAPQRTSILVLPQITALPELHIAPAGFYGDGRPQRSSLQQTIHASTVREYVFGDALRQIHWPTTARAGQLYVRLMESAPEGEWWILLDLDEKTMFGTGWESIEEQSVALAASLTAHGLRARKSVGVISSGAKLTWLAPRKGEGQRWEIFEALALAKPGARTLEEVLEHIHPTLGRHHSLIIITAATSTDWTKFAPALRTRAIAPTVMLFDAATFGAPNSAEPTAALLAERGIKCHLLSKGVVAAPQLELAGDTSWSWRATPSGEIVPVRN